MSEPRIPHKDHDEALADLMESIALEETALAHLINTEAEKIQEFIGRRGVSVSEAIELQQEVRKVMQLILQKQILLQFKLEEVAKFKEH